MEIVWRYSTRNDDVQRVDFRSWAMRKLIVDFERLLFDGSSKWILHSKSSWTIIDDFQMRTAFGVDFGRCGLCNKRNEAL